MRQRESFTLAESAESADVTLGVVSYQRDHYEDYLMRGFEVYPHVLESHSLDAVAVAEVSRGELAGLDVGLIRDGPSLCEAAERLVNQLERFCRGRCRIRTGTSGRSE